jgi:glycosyltransferase involved in cell wall biosynthesis
VSVLLAVHNGAEFIGAAIDSVIAQSLPSWELIVVSNGSTDETAAICQRQAAADSRIRFFELPEKGKNRAYNHAWLQSRGRFVSFFAADDLLTPDSLAARLEAVEDAGPNGFSTCCLQTFSADPKYDGALFPRQPDRPNYSGGSIFFTRELGNRIFPLPEEQPNEDTWAQLHLRAFGVNRHIPRPLYRYRIHGANSYGYGVPFEKKRTGYLKRMHAYRLFLDRYRDSGLPFVHDEVEPFVRGLDAATEDNILGILRVRGLRLDAKAMLIFYCSKVLYGLRHSSFKAFSGITTR